MIEPVSPFGPVAELKPRKELQVMVEVSALVVSCAGTAQSLACVVVTLLVTPFTVVFVTVPVVS